MNNEIWKDIEGYEGEYQVSNLGRVRRISVKILKPEVRPVHLPYKYAQSRVSLKGRKYAVHRLVAQAFIPNPSGKPQVNHKDNNPQNNCVDNLEWVSAKENTRHALLNGFRKMKLPYEEYDYVCAEYLNGRSMESIAEEYGVHASRISAVLKTKGIESRGKGGGKSGSV